MKSGATTAQTQRIVAYFLREVLYSVRLPMAGKISEGIFFDKRVFELGLILLQNGKIFLQKQLIFNGYKFRRCFNKRISCKVGDAINFNFTAKILPDFFYQQIEITIAGK